jgi:hypothetical protein
MSTDIYLRRLQKEVKVAEKLARNLSSNLLTLIQFREEIKDPVYRRERIALLSAFQDLIPVLKSFYESGRK